MMEANAVAHTELKNHNRATLRSRYKDALHQVKAHELDEACLKTAGVWQKVMEARGYEDNEPIRTKQEWAAIDRSVLGACVIKPFRPLRFRFKWH